MSKMFFVLIAIVFISSQASACGKHSEKSAQTTSHKKQKRTLAKSTLEVIDPQVTAEELEAPIMPPADEFVEAQVKNTEE